MSQRSLGQDGKLLGASGKLIRDYSHFVFTIQAKQYRDDWFSISTVSNSRGELLSALREGDIPEVQLRFEVFNRTARAYPDLLPRDANRIVNLVEKELAEQVTGTLTAGKTLTIGLLEKYPRYQ